MSMARTWMELDIISVIWSDLNGRRVPAVEDLPASAHQQQDQRLLAVHR